MDLPWNARPAPEPEPEPEVAPDPDAPPPHRPAVGEVLGYESHDAYSSPPRDRVQLVMVTGISDDGQVYGQPLGFADDGAVFGPGVLKPLQ